MMTAMGKKPLCSSPYTGHNKLRNGREADGELMNLGRIRRYQRIFLSCHSCESRNPFGRAKAEPNP
ncbi:MAG: hypothetical protein AAF471_03520 [Myxococcota bacterium]